MKSEEDKRGLDFDTLLQEAKGAKYGKETPTNGEEDGHKKVIVVHITSLSNDGSLSFDAGWGGIRMDENLFERALSEIGEPYYLLAWLLGEEKQEQRRVLGCLTGNPLLEIRHRTKMADLHGASCGPNFLPRLPKSRSRLGNEVLPGDEEEDEDEEKNDKERKNSGKEEDDKEEGDAITYETPVKKVRWDGDVSGEEKLGKPLLEGQGKELGKGLEKCLVVEGDINNEEMKDALKHLDIEIRDHDLRGIQEFLILYV